MFPGQWSPVSKTQEMSIPNRNREGPRTQPPPSKAGSWELGTAFRRREREDPKLTSIYLEGTEFEIRNHFNSLSWKASVFLHPWKW